MENLQGLKQGTKNTEVWNVCWSFGMPNHIQAKYTFYQICKAVEQIHDCDIMHWDLKPENMFFQDDRKYVKIVDFGSSKIIDEPDIFIDDNPKRKQHLNFVGTP